MNSDLQKIKLEEEVQGSTSPTVTSRLPISVTPESVTDQAVYREALVSFEQLIESYRYRSAGHPVAIKIEETDQKEKSDLEIAEELLEDPEFAQAAERESLADRQVREHLESHKRAVRAGTRKATFESQKLLKKAKVSRRYRVTAETEESESLANIATRAANTNFYTTSVPVPVIPDPEREILGPDIFAEEEEVQPKVEDFDC